MVPRGAPAACAQALQQTPAVPLSARRRETLGLLCASSPLMSNPLALLRRCMTPPEAEVPAGEGRPGSSRQGGCAMGPRSAVAELARLPP